MSKLGKILFLTTGLSALILLVARLFLGGWHNMLWAPLGIAAIGFLAALIVDIKFYLEFLSMRTTKHGMNMGVLILLGTLLIVAINFLGNRYNKNFDLTQEGINSLSDQTVQTLNSLQDDLEILVFYQGKSDQEIRSQLKTILQTYTDASKKVKVKFVDAYTDIELSKKYLTVNDRFAVVAQYQGRTQRIEDPSQEDKVTSAIIKVTRKESKSIAFLTGHQEHDIDAVEQSGLKAFAEALREDSFQVSKVNLLTGDTLPDPQSGVLAIIGPKTPFMDAELEKIRTFLREGGHLFLAIDPGENHQLANLTKTFGVEFKNNYIASETRLQGTGIATVIGLNYDSTSDVTKKFKSNDSITLFHLASEVAKAPDASAELTVKEIVKSHSSSFIMNNIKNIPQNPERSERTLVVSVQGKIADIKDDKAIETAEKPAGEKREFAAVVFGDSDFLINATIPIGMNKDLALNAVAYLAGEGNLITIRPKKRNETPITITETTNLAIFSGGVGMPILLIIISGILWYRRRNL